MKESFKRALLVGALALSPIMSKVVGQNENNKNEIKIENLAGKEIEVDQIGKIVETYNLNVNKERKNFTEEEETWYTEGYRRARLSSRNPNKTKIPVECNNSKRLSFFLFGFYTSLDKLGGKRRKTTDIKISEAEKIRRGNNESKMIKKDLEGKGNCGIGRQKLKDFKKK